MKTTRQLSHQLPPILPGILLGLALGLATNLTAAVSYDQKSPQLKFAARAVESALAARGEQAAVTLTVDTSAELKSEGFSILRDGAAFKVMGKDSAGAMYGGLDLAETIRSEGVAAVRPKQQNPYLPMRGIKFNLPLDARTPTYSAFGDATEKNTAEIWDLGFWREYIDTLAAYRYNHVALWSLHPFPMMVKVPDYPEVALADVMLSKGPFEDVYRGDAGSNWEPPILDQKNLKTVKKMTIDEKIAFWREVMAYGKTRNVDFYIVTWNIFTCGVEGKYGINDDPRNETTIDYFRKSIKELILTYPDLAGIGLTTGENMVLGAREAKMTNEAKEDWIVRTYAAGTLDALKLQPARKLRFIHRQHQAGVDLVLEKMKPVRDHPNVDFVFSFKYAEAHVFSATRQPFHEKFTPVIREAKVKTLWTLRNDDVYLFRWAAPDFVREFVKNIPHDVSQGYYYGHDGFVNGREFTQRDPETPRQLEVQKHWLQWMLWGRLGYDPDYSNERIAALLSARYPGTDGRRLLEAWQNASMVYPRVTGFHWGSLDWKWYIEGTKGIKIFTDRVGGKSPTGFHDVETFINVPIHEHGGVQSIPEYVAGKPTKHLSPLALADLIDRDVEAASAGIKTFKPAENKELRLTLDDIAIICEMGRYYADKIRGSTHVALARVSKKQADKDAAIKTLTEASEHYKKFVGLVTANHVNRIWLSRVGTVDFEQQISEAMVDIAIAREIAAQ